MHGVRRPSSALSRLRSRFGRRTVRERGRHALAQGKTLPGSVGGIPVQGQYADVRTAHGGVVMLVTLIFLALFACMAVAVAASANMNMTITRNRTNAQQADALAEAGLRLAQHNLGGLKVPSTDNATDLNRAIADQLRTTWSPSDSIAYDNDKVIVPPTTISRDDGRTGTITLEILSSGGAVDDPTITIRSTGGFANATRTASYTVAVRRARSALFDHGLASRGRIVMGGNARLLGATDAEEGSLLAGTYSTNEAVVLDGNAEVAGDISVINPGGTISKGPNVDVGGVETIGVHEPEWPEPDVSIFRPYATNVQSGGASGDTLLTNILIPPNTNPTFSGNTFIYGVIYVQSPNTVTFEGNTTLVGLIVCEPPAIEDLAQNKLEFAGNLSSSGVENLPPGTQFDGLRELTGASILAEGYAVEFGGNFNTISGSMIAGGFEFAGNATGRIRGGVVALSDAAITLGGNANLTIDRENAPAEVAGVTVGLELVCVSGSYGE